MNGSVLLLSSDLLIIRFLQHFFKKQCIEIIICPDNFEEYVVNNYKNHSCIITDSSIQNKTSISDFLNFVSKNPNINSHILLLDDQEYYKSNDYPDFVTVYPRNLSMMDEMIYQIRIWIVEHIEVQNITDDSISNNISNNENNVTILLADDSKPIRKFVSGLLLQNNFNSMVFENGQQLLNYLYDGNKGDIIILDNEMPIKCGIDTLKELKNHTDFKNIPVIFLSGITDKDQIVRALQLGADDYIEKPFNNDEFFARLNVHLKIDHMKKELVKKSEKITEQKDQIQEKLVEIQQHSEKLRESFSIIEEKNKNITHSINYAKRIQEASLPPLELFAEMFPASFVLFRPRDIVSGDFYWLKKINHYILLTAADCTGHGVPGAFMSMLGVAFLNQTVSHKSEIVASELLGELRDNVKLALRQNSGGSASKDGMDMALCIIDTKNQTINFAGAHNSLILIRKSDVPFVAEHFFENKLSEKNREKIILMNDNGYNLLQLKGDKMPIGVYVDQAPQFSDFTFKYYANDRLYLFSDGYVDQFGFNMKSKYLISRFRNLLIDLQSKSLPEQKEVLEFEYLQWKDKLDQMDDVLVVGVQL